MTRRVASWASGGRCQAALLAALAAMLSAHLGQCLKTQAPASSWQEAIELLFVNPRGSALEPTEALRLLELARGRKVGPFDVDHLLALHHDARAGNNECPQERFRQIDEAMKLSEARAKPLELYLENCLKRQVAACKFEFNFKRAVAKLESEQTRDLERLADLIEEPPQRVDLTLGANILAYNHDEHSIARGVKLMVERAAFDEGEKQGAELRRRLVGLVDSLKRKCAALPPGLEGDVLGTLRYAQTIREDRIVMRWFKVLQVCLALKRESQLLNQVHALWLRDADGSAPLNASPLRSLRDLIG